MKDLFEKILTKSSALGQYAEQAEGIMMFPELEGPIGPRMMYRGHEYIVWSINNYLGLANHPQVRAADAKAAEQWGAAYPMGGKKLRQAKSSLQVVVNQRSELSAKKDTQQSKML
jgi:glycine C-acetyltransferase